MEIKVNIKERRAQVLGSPIIVCGNTDNSIAFTFDSEWAATQTRTARFVYIQDGAVKYTDVVFTGSKASVPLLSNTREVQVGVYAGELRTTTPARIPCEPSILCGTGSPEEPTPSQYDQIMALLNSVSALDAVRFAPQDLGEEQKSIARNNLDVVSQAEHAALQKQVGAAQTTASQALQDAQELEDLLAEAKRLNGFKRLLTKDDDCDNLKENGVYVYQTQTVTDGLKNAPFPNAAVIEVFGADSEDTQKIQRAYRYGAAGYSAYRQLLSKTWGRWVKAPLLYKIDFDTNEDGSAHFSGDQTAEQLYEDLENGNPVIVMADMNANSFIYFQPTVKLLGSYILCSTSRKGQQYSFSLTTTRGSALTANNPHADHVIGEGTDGGWSYQIWATGKVKCWGTTSHKPTAAVANGGNVSVPFTLPLEFTSAQYFIQPRLLAYKVKKVYPFSTSGTEQTLLAVLEDSENLTTSQTMSFDIMVLGTIEL